MIGKSAQLPHQTQQLTSFQFVQFSSVRIGSDRFSWDQFPPSGTGGTSSAMQLAFRALHNSSSIHTVSAKSIFSCGQRRAEEISLGIFRLCLRYFQSDKRRNIGAISYRVGSGRKPLAVCPYDLFAWPRRQAVVHGGAWWWMVVGGGSWWCGVVPRWLCGWCCPVCTYNLTPPTISGDERLARIHWEKCSNVLHFRFMLLTSDEKIRML